MKYVGFGDLTVCLCPKSWAAGTGAIVRTDTQAGCPEHDPFTDGDLDSPPDGDGP